MNLRTTFILFGLTITAITIINFTEILDPSLLVEQSSLATSVDTEHNQAIQRKVGSALAHSNPDVIIRAKETDDKTKNVSVSTKVPFDPSVDEAQIELVLLSVAGNSKQVVAVVDIEADLAALNIPSIADEYVTSDSTQSPFELDERLLIKPSNISSNPEGKFSTNNQVLEQIENNEIIPVFEKVISNSSLRFSDLENLENLENLEIEAFIKNDAVYIID